MSCLYHPFQNQIELVSNIKFRYWAVLMMLCLLPACGADTPPDVESPRVTVIGAGVSGLTSAKRLSEAGFSVTVLEARDRIGGRTWSHKTATGTTLDLGASWIHGDYPPFENLAKELNIELVNTDYGNLLIHDSTGNSQYLNDIDTDKLEESLEYGVVLANLMGATASIQDVVNSLWSMNALSDYTREFVNFVTTAEIEVSSAASAEDITVRSYLSEIKDILTGSDDAGDEEGVDSVEDTEEDGTEVSKNLAFPGGYNQISDHLAEGLDIQLNTTVLNINYGQDPLVITTSRGEINTDLVIVTVPIGVLKAGDIVFSPKLPNWKQDTIDRMGSGLLNKLYLEFPYSFWEQDPDLIGITRPEKGGLALWVNMQKLTKSPTLMAFSAGRSAIELEALSDSEIVERAMSRLTQAYGKDIPQPVDVVRTRWASDPFAKGSYSYESLDAGFNDESSLSRPVNARVLFAGEATAINNSANVPGAHETGLREAERIIDWYPGVVKAL